MSTETMPPTALELARRIRQGEESCVDVVERTFETIDALNPELYAFVSLQRRRALALARWQDRRKRSDALPPFFGVPTGIKDLQPVRWTFTRMGSAAFRWFFTPFDDLMVKSLRKGGFNLIGKLSTPEFGVLPITEPDIHPPTRNPHDPTRTPGGSSGGSATAVASGMLSIAAGSDGGGSIRIPSAYCGLFGFKPSRGLMPTPVKRIDTLGLVVVGPIARSVEDAAAMLDVMTGQSIKAPNSFSSAIARPPKKLKVAFCVNAPFGQVAPELVQSTLAVVKVLTHLGHDVSEISCPDVGSDDFLRIWSRMFASIPVLAPRSLQPATRWFRGIGKSVSKQEARHAFERIVAGVERLLAGFDILVTPTTAVIQPKIHAFSDCSPEQLLESIRPIAAFTASFNIGGNPAASIPSGKTAEGLPLGVQIGAHPGNDHLVFQVSRQIEQAIGSFDPLAS